MSDQLKAYCVREDFEGHACVVFATNGATARRLGANELDLGFNEVDSCRRMPSVDSYAPGPVPPSVLIGHGWWFECLHCGRRVEEDMVDYLEEDDQIKPEDLTPIDFGDQVFCSKKCEDGHHEDKRLKREAKEELKKIFLAKFPDSIIEDAHVYGTKLEAPEQNGGARCSVKFKFPGCKYGATFVYGSDVAYVANADLEAFKDYQDKLALKAASQ